MNFKLPATFLAIAAIFAIATPANSLALSAAAKKKQIQSTLKQLQKLPNRKAAPARIFQLVKKLAKLDPKKANLYYRVGLPKFGPQGAESNARRLSTQVIAIVKKSDLSPKVVKSITKQVTKTEIKYTPPRPTPPPYQASVAPPGPTRLIAA